MDKMRRAARWLPGFALAGLSIVLGASGVAAEDQITLGAAVSATGKYALNGANTKNGYDLAVDTINAMGGVTIGDKRYKLVVKYYDDESTPARGTELAERLIKQDGVKFILGPCSSGLTKAMLPIVERYHVPMVETDAAARELFTKGYRYAFAVLPTSEQYLTEIIKLAAENAEKLGKDPASITVAHGHGGRPRCPGHARGRARRYPAARHEAGDRRSIAARAERHVDDARQGQNAQARSPGDFRP